MSTTRSLPLRILYTINSSPQYILARSLSAYPVQPVSECTAEDQGDSHQLYGTVAFKHCLDTICRSSPELLQDRSRDYSVYVLDPLESLSAPTPIGAHASSSERRSQQSGVAVGLGLMSWARVSEESKSLQIAGTLINNGRAALEVVFALRETPATNLKTVSPPPIVAEKVTSRRRRQEPSKIDEQLLSPLSLAKARAKRVPPPPPPPKRVVPEQPPSEADLLMASGVTYTGPPRKWGRPRSGRPRSKDPPQSVDIEDDEEEDDPPPASPKNQRLAAWLSSCSTHSQQPPSEVSAGSTVDSPQTTSIPLPTDALLPSTNPLSEAQTAVLLDALMAIDSTTPGNSVSATNPALVSALRQLVSAAAADRLNHNTSRTTHTRVRAHPASISGSESNSPSKSQDDEVVILDKENVNPTAFRRRAERERAEAKRMLLTSGIASSSRQVGGSEAATTSILGAPRDLNKVRTVSNRSSSYTHVPAANPAQEEKVTRKRRLSDLMDERDSVRKRVGQRDAHRYYRTIEPLCSRAEAKQYYRQPEQSAAHIMSDPPTFDRSESPSSIAGPSTSPPPQRQHSLHIWHESSTIRSSSVSVVISPKRGRILSTSASSPVVPSMSKTSKRPRQKYVVPEWARTTTATQPRLSEEAQKALEDAAAQQNEEIMNRKRAKARKQTFRGRDNASQKPGLVRADTGDGTQVSQQSSQTPPSAIYSDPLTSNNIHPVFASSDPIIDSCPPTRPVSPSPYTSQPEPEIPSTPPRRHDILHDSSLFTPTPKGRDNGNPLFSPFGAMGSPVPQSSIWGKMVGPHGLQIPDHESDDEEDLPVHAPSETMPKETMTPNAESPPDSLPIASSDTEDDESMNCDPAGETVPVKEHWTDLPPSSPPPPSSPFEDASTLPSESTDTQDLTMTPTLSNADLAMYFDVNEFDAYYASVNNPSSRHGGAEPLSDAALFNQFTHLASDDSLAQAQDGLSLELPADFSMPDNINDLDFTELWQTMVPLLEAGASADTRQDSAGLGLDISSQDDRSQEPQATADIDHEKLAQEVHALFSGCLM
ncbi:hypothetical protein PLEOSDRAFT_1104708 [Pleurotus ostreatus PC15]|uniref:Ams2/SPT21 N-terminal domain-containing protein n=1 Tax=Pleurotus ostreatus (strain PC15) TaxID=1137138 RepID=A0A067NLZ0_PLEO1|nr:hypothetical protein PLEOSDRAFT_1104708 [Pleurotus ostreatus PC15]